jgi:hypothetical protein
MLSRMAFVPAFGKELQCTANDRPRPDIEVHRLGTQ